MKALMLVAMIGLAGCATANPIDMLWPTPTDHTTHEVLGDDAPDASIVPWHTLADTKAEKEAIDAKVQVWVARGELAKKNTSSVIAQNNPVSIGIYSLITMILAALGWVSPSPSEKHKVEKALHTPVPND